ncbi:MAG: hypothetical protein ACR2OX_13120 [Methyloligellaceae bacterium]
MTEIKPATPDPVQCAREFIQSGDKPMDELQIRQHARRLIELNGPAAIAVAAQKAASYEESGDVEQARNWKRIEIALKEMRGPHQG